MSGTNSCLHTYEHSHLSTRLCTCLYRTHVYTHACTHSCAHVCVHVCTRVYTHAYTHALPHGVTICLYIAPCYRAVPTDVRISMYQHTLHTWSRTHARTYPCDCALSFLFYTFCWEQSDAALAVGAVLVQLPPPTSTESLVRIGYLVYD